MDILKQKLTDFAKERESMYWGLHRSPGSKPLKRTQSVFHFRSRNGYSFRKKDLSRFSKRC